MVEVCEKNFPLILFLKVLIYELLLQILTIFISLMILFLFYYYFSMIQFYFCMIQYFLWKKKCISEFLITSLDLFWVITRFLLNVLSCPKGLLVITSS